MRAEGKLTNTDGEFIASGPCEVDRERGEVTMWPAWEVHLLEREDGGLLLDLDDGTRLEIHARHLTFKLHGPKEQRTTVYRLRIVERVPEHMTSRDEEPAPVPPEPAAARALRVVKPQRGDGSF